MILPVAGKKGSWQPFGCCCCCFSRRWHTKVAYCPFYALHFSGSSRPNPRSHLEYLSLQSSPLTLPRWLALHSLSLSVNRKSHWAKPKAVLILKFALLNNTKCWNNESHRHKCSTLWYPSYNFRKKNIDLFMMYLFFKWKQSCTEYFNLIYKI